MLRPEPTGRAVTMVERTEAMTKRQMKARIVCECESMLDVIDEGERLGPYRCHLIQKSPVSLLPELGVATSPRSRWTVSAGIGHSARRRPRLERLVAAPICVWLKPTPTHANTTPRICALS